MGKSRATNNDLTHAEVSRRGGKARTAAKREASLRNLERATAAKAARYKIAGGYLHLALTRKAEPTWQSAQKQ